VTSSGSSGILSRFSFFRRHAPPNRAGAPYDHGGVFSGIGINTSCPSGSPPLGPSRLMFVADEHPSPGARDLVLVFFRSPPLSPPFCKDLEAIISDGLSPPLPHPAEPCLLIPRLSFFPTTTFSLSPFRKIGVTVFLLWPSGLPRGRRPLLGLGILFFRVTNRLY